MKFSKKTFLGFIVLSLSIFSFFAFQPTKPLRHSPNDNFTVGEKLVYRLHYGFITAGEATVAVDPQYYVVNDRVCYKIFVNGSSTGSFDFVMKIRDQFISYVDTGAMLPHKAYRLIREGKYKLDETVYFDQANHTARMKRNNDTETQHVIANNVQDIVSGYYFLRTVRFDKQKVGDTTSINAFFEGKGYDFRVRYLGKEVVNTKLGKINAIKLSPIMPDNQMFKGGNAISFWVSDDKNRVPLKVEAVLFVGSVELDLKSCSGLKWQLNMAK